MKIRPFARKPARRPGRLVPTLDSLECRSLLSNAPGPAASWADFSPMGPTPFAAARPDPAITTAPWATAGNADRSGPSARNFDAMGDAPGAFAPPTGRWPTFADGFAMRPAIEGGRGPDLPTSPPTPAAAPFRNEQVGARDTQAASSPPLAPAPATFDRAVGPTLPPSATGVVTASGSATPAVTAPISGTAPTLTVTLNGAGAPSTSELKLAPISRAVGVAGFEAPSPLNLREVPEEVPTAAPEGVEGETSIVAPAGAPASPPKEAPSGASSPRGADLISSFAPFDRATLDRAFARLRDRIGSLAGPMEGRPIEVPLLFPIATAAVALVMARRSRRRQRGQGTTPSWKTPTSLRHGLF